MSITKTNRSRKKCVTEREIKMAENISEIESQKIKVQKMIQLIQKNPSLRILPMVDGELGGADFSYYAGSFINVEIDEVYYSDERIYFKSFDEEELEEGLFNKLEGDNPSWSDSYLDEQAKVEVASLGWEKVIVVKIGVP